MKTNYKYWIFYANEEYIDDLTCLIDKDNLIYAYTDDKQIANIFEIYHDMSKIKKKHVNLTRFEVNQLAKDHQTKIIKMRKFLTKDKDGKKMEINIPVTVMEEKHVDLQIVATLNKLIYQVVKSPCPVKIFREDIIKEFEKIRLFSIINHSKLNEDYINIGNDCILFSDNLKKGSKIFADELSIYIHLFGNILNLNIGGDI